MVSVSVTACSVKMKRRLKVSHLQHRTENALILYRYSSWRGRHPTLREFLLRTLVNAISYGVCRCPTCSIEPEVP